MKTTGSIFKKMFSKKNYLKKLFALFIVIVSFSKKSFAQTVDENTGWLAWFNSYKFSEKCGLHFDGQLRSADDWSYVRTILLRPGLIYYINSNNNLTAGYAFIQTQNKVDGDITSLTENRIWEQYINNMKFKQVLLQNRFRLEQRFIERTANDVFAQRFRYFVRTIVPLQKQKAAFSEGVYAALQNELFFNIQNKDELNNKLFDQNRAYAAIGYRINKKTDIETGYMNQYIKGRTNNTSNNVIQLALYTRF